MLFFLTVDNFENTESINMIYQQIPQRHPNEAPSFPSAQCADWPAVRASLYRGVWGQGTTTLSPLLASGLRRAVTMRNSSLPPTEAQAGHSSSLAGVNVSQYPTPPPPTLSSSFGPLQRNGMGGVSNQAPEQPQGLAQEQQGEVGRQCVLPRGWGVLNRPT